MIRALAPLLIAALATTPALAKDDELAGSVEIGYRTAEVNGNEDKYREDVNLRDDAFRLFGVDLEYRPAEATWFDTFLLNANDLGGEPFSGGRLLLRKAGRYELDLRYRQADYFHRDAGYWLNPAGDLHTWNTERELFSLGLAVETTDWLKLRFGADVAERDGRSMTTRDVQRDVFQLVRPVDQESSTYWAAADFRWAWADITVEQRFYSHENDWDLSTTNDAGQDPGDPASLDDYRQTRTEDADTPITRLSIRGRPIDRFRFVIDFAHADAEIDFDTDGAWDGLDFNGDAFRTTLTNRGSVDRTSDLLDVDLFFNLVPDLDMIVDYSHRTFDQDGTIDLVEDQVGGAEEGTIVVRGDLSNDLDLDRIGLTFDWRATPAVSVMAGVGLQERTKDFELSGPEVETERTLWRAGVRWRPSRKWDLRLDYEQGDDDDPLTQISSTSTDRLRFRARMLPIEGLSVALNYADESKENDLRYALGAPTDDVPPADEIFLARFDVTSAALVVNWSRNAWDVTAGYTDGEIDSNAHIVYVTDSTFFPVFDIFTTRDVTAYTSDYDVVNAAVRYRIGSHWRIGGELVFSDNAGSFPVQSDYYELFGQYDFDAGPYLRLAFETYDYDEDNPFAGDPASPTPDVNDYDADLWTFYVGYRF